MVVFQLAARLRKILNLLLIQVLRKHKNKKTTAQASMMPNTNIDSKQQQRQHQLERWCAQQSQLEGKSFDFKMVSGDASFRRYFRIVCQQASFIAVDAPPEHEDSRQFCKVAALFETQACVVPKVYASDFEQGFMLLSDLGDTMLLDELNEKNVEGFYAQALEELVKLQAAKLKGGELPLYNKQKLIDEMALFQQWFVEDYLVYSLSQKERKLIEDTQGLIADEVLKQQQVIVHRDFHSRNIMVLPGKLALIDFQDALIGPITYDAVSLLKDCYLEWPDAQREEYLQSYFNKLLEKNISQEKNFKNFYVGFEWMGLQRHLKVLGIFSRLSIRDGKDAYLNDLPLTFKYVEEVLEKIPELSEFKVFFEDMVKPLFELKNKDRGKSS
jgi:aminoglycoside/choline kinase family phosphotransferase